MKKIDFTILGADEVFGINTKLLSKRQLYIFKQNKDFIRAEVTDLAIALGCQNSYYNEIIGMFIGSYWTKDNREYYNWEYDEYKTIVYHSGVDALAGLKDINIGVRPAFSIDREFYENGRTSRYFGVLTVEYGEYPQRKVSDELAKELEEKYRNGKLQTTIKEYRFYDRYGSLSYYCEYVYGLGKYVRLVGDYRGMDPYEVVWLRVEPITWLIDERDNIAVSEKILFSGIKYSDFDNSRFKNSLIKKYLDEYFSKQIEPSTYLDMVHAKNIEKAKEIIEGKTIEEEPEKSEESEESKKVNQIIDEIRKYIPYYHGNIDINKRIDELMDNYNENIMSRLNNDTILTLDLDEKALYLGLLNDLNNILDNLKLSYEKNKKYIEILKFIDKCIKSLGEEVLDNELCKDLNTISTVILSYLNKDSNELKDMLEYEKNNITKYLEDMDNLITSDIIIPYDSIETFELIFRGKLHNYLHYLKENVDKKYIVDSIKSSYKNILDGNYEKTKSERIKFFMDLINELSNNIKNRGNSNDISLLENILSNFDINYEDDIKAITDSLVSTILKLYRIIFDIEEREEHNKQVSKYIVKKRTND